MSPSGHKPFDADVVAFGGYQYTRGDRLSNVLANRRFSEMIRNATDFHGRSVADVGCGDGTFTIELARTTGAREVVGIDPSEPAVTAARAAAEGVNGIAFRAGTAATVAAEGRRFDIAVYRGVIHHVENPADEIATAFRIASVAIFLEPNGFNPVVKILEKVSPYHREHEERSYPQTRLHQWIEHGGGTVESSVFFGLVPFFSPDWIARTTKTLEPLVERVPLLRAAVCGQVLVTARSRG